MDIPIACRLDPDGLADRRREWEALRSSRTGERRTATTLTTTLAARRRGPRRGRAAGGRRARVLPLPGPRAHDPRRIRDACHGVSAGTVPERLGVV